MPGQMTAHRMGANLETGMYICHAAGAFPYTNVKFRWNEILKAQDLNETAKLWSPLTRAFQQLRFKFLDNVDSNFACSLRKDGRLEGFRSFLRKIWKAVDGDIDPSKSESVARDFGDELTQAYSDAQAEWQGIDRDLLKWFVPTMGSALVGGIFSPLFASAGLAVAGLGEIIQAEMKRRAFRQRVTSAAKAVLQNPNVSQRSSAVPPKIRIITPSCDPPHILPDPSSARLSQDWRSAFVCPPAATTIHRCANNFFRRSLTI